ncbi:tRNA lysidine(34) synthetase TilS [Mucilaginibacter calamicampi]|uniref:tRNA(Ile)-lysidine synthase n=1 Tax=Mucilaginibacter calamicampi TaxID=1302352 RepID=A0ABW2Z5E0_9SPHI
MLPLKRFTDFIKKNHLFTRDSNLLVAVSGGIDSVAMVHLLNAAGYKFTIAHCNFQLRPEADADQEFCHKLALHYQTPFCPAWFNTQHYAAERKISIQMAARELRYEFFEQVALRDNYTCIALAHHQNDTVETILLNLVRGTGIAGMHGILPKNGNLVRPMLCFTRSEIEQIVTENNLDYVEDSSNASVKYARNKIRHVVIAPLKELNPSLEQTFENNIRHFKELEQLLELKVEEVRQKLFSHRGTEIHIAVDEVKQLVPQRLLLFKLLQAYGFSEHQVDDVIASLNKHAGRKFETPFGYLLVLDRGVLVLTRKIQEVPSVFIADTDSGLIHGTFKLTISKADEAVIIKNNPLAVSVDTEKLEFPLLLRYWRQSDHFYPLGMKGKKKVSDFFVDQKIPLHLKKTIPLLINANGDIIWIAGYRPDERYKVTDNTKKVTIFELLPIDPLAKL